MGWFCISKRQIIVRVRGNRKKSMGKMWENDKGSFARGNCLGRGCGEDNVSLWNIIVNCHKAFTAHSQKQQTCTAGLEHEWVFWVTAGNTTHCILLGCCSVLQTWREGGIVDMKRQGRLFHLFMLKINSFWKYDWVSEEYETQSSICYDLASGKQREVKSMQQMHTIAFKIPLSPQKFFQGIMPVLF